MWVYVCKYMYVFVCEYAIVCVYVFVEENVFKRARDS